MGKRTVRIGNSGEDVTDLQMALVALGLMPPSSTTGKFDTATGRAVLEFQRAHELAPDGVVGPKTWAALASHVPAEMPDWETDGPATDDHPSVFSADGFWSLARIVHAAPGRIGPAIRPRAVVVHTTDMVPGTMGAVVRSWSRPESRGACAHFIVGRGPEDGVVQMVSIYRNGSHAGGSKLVDGKQIPWHGDWKTGGKLVHPNTWAVGIELDGAGRLKKVGGKWIQDDTGREFAPADVYVDERGGGWHKLTEYQRATLNALLDELEETIAPMPADTTVVPNGTYKANGVPWAAVDGVPRVVGHVTLNPNNKTDPGPQVMGWLEDRRKR